MKEEKDKIIEDFKEVLSLTKRYIKQEKERGMREVVVNAKFKVQNAKFKVQNAKSEEALERLRKEVEGCKKCPLWKSRNNVVFGEGNPNARLILVGEAPGRNEDLQGKPFVGAAGKLLTKILASIDIKREDVFIGNILKCRPPLNRNPKPEEIKACWSYLDRQLRIIKPEFILATGTFAAQTLLRTDERIGRLRGKFYPFAPLEAGPVRGRSPQGGRSRAFGRAASNGAGRPKAAVAAPSAGRPLTGFAKGVKLLATYHPAALLRNPGYKRGVWEDMKLLKKEYQKL